VTECAYKIPAGDVSPSVEKRIVCVGMRGQKRWGVRIQNANFSVFISRGGIRDKVLCDKMRF
jgi:hypothetical protein